MHVIGSCFQLMTITLFHQAITNLLSKSPSQVVPFHGLMKLMNQTTKSLLKKRTTEDFTQTLTTTVIKEVMIFKNRKEIGNYRRDKEISHIVCRSMHPTHRRRYPGDKKACILLVLKEKFFCKDTSSSTFPSWSRKLLVSVLAPCPNEIMENCHFCNVCTWKHILECSGVFQNKTFQARLLHELPFS